LATISSTAGEEAIGDVDRDSLLALGAQPVGDRGQIRESRS
jgi:hypothetical protein